MCRRSPSAPPPPLVVLVVLLLTASTGTARVHVQSSPADIGIPVDRNAGEGGAADFAGHQVIKVFVAGNSTLDLLRSYEDTPGVDFWTPVSPLTPAVDVMVSPEVRPQLMDQLTRSGASYTVNIDNVQAAIHQESSTMTTTERELLMGRSGHPLTWRAYHSLEDHHQYLDFIEQNYVGLCETFSIGRSTEGRDLKGIRYPRAGVALPCRRLVPGQGIRPESVHTKSYRTILHDYYIYFMPVLNVDGYEYSRSSADRRFWRKTRSRNPGSSCIGTDPNRNFDVHWGLTGSSNNPCRDTYRGARPFSEPETRAVRNFLLSRGPAMRMYISFHSYLQMLFVPYAFDKSRPADYNELLEVAEAGAQALWRASGKRYEVGQASQLLYSAAGGSDDWAKAKAGIKYSYTFELRDKGKYGFLAPPKEIEGTCQEIVAAVTTMVFKSDKK